ncbi:MAG: hypothetical protein AABW75_04955 [Nanoarchaeota archaeon]
MERNKPYIFRYLFAFFIATILFVMIFVVAYWISYLNYKGISKENALITGYIVDFERYINESTCSDKILAESTIKLDIVVSRLGILESRFGKDDPRVLEQKELFSQLSFKHFQLVKKLIDLCDADITTFLFFYSNEKDYEDESEHVGVILSTLKNKYKALVMVYSYDFNLNSDLIKKIKTQYNVNKAPIVVVNEKEVVQTRNIDDLEQYILNKTEEKG